MEQRKDIKDYDVINVAITNEEIRSTFGLCSDTPGPDGISARMIDKASRDQMILCQARNQGGSWGFLRTPLKPQRSYICHYLVTRSFTVQQSYSHIGRFDNFSIILFVLYSVSALCSIVIGFRRRTQLLKKTLPLPTWVSGWLVLSH